MIAIIGDDGKIEGWIMEAGDPEPSPTGSEAPPPGTQVIIPLRVVGGTAHEKDERARDVIMQLALAHMMAGLRVANRLRGERGQPPLSAQEILHLLDVVDEEAYGG